LINFFIDFSSDWSIRARCIFDDTKASQLFLNYSMICHLSNTRKYCQIWLILLELYDPKVINRENMKKDFFPNTKNYIIIQLYKLLIIDNSHSLQIILPTNSIFVIKVSTKFFSYFYCCSSVSTRTSNVRKCRRTCYISLSIISDRSNFRFSIN